MGFEIISTAKIGQSLLIAGRAIGVAIRCVGVSGLSFLGGTEDVGPGFVARNAIVKFFTGFEQSLWESFGLLAAVLRALGLFWKIVSSAGFVGLRSQCGFGFGICIGVGR